MVIKMVNQNLKNKSLKNDIKIDYQTTSENELIVMLENENYIVSVFPSFVTVDRKQPIRTFEKIFLYTTGNMKIDEIMHKKPVNQELGES